MIKNYSTIRGKRLTIEYIEDLLAHGATSQEILDVFVDRNLNQP